MAYANGTLHYNLPQTVGTDVRDWSDTNQAFEDVDTALYGAVSDVATASSGVTALDTQLNAPTTGVVAQLGQAQTDITGLDGRVQTLEGTVSNHTSQIADVRADCEDMICAFNETSSTSTHDYAIGDYFRYNDVLYEAIAVINIGDTITPDTNCKTTNVTTELLDIKGATDKVGDLSTLTTTAKTNCVAAINEVNSAVGTLSSLTTTDKSSTVAAINELDNDIGDLSQLTTTDKNNLVEAINEVAGSTGGSVSATMLATDTFAQALGKLYAVVDTSKITDKSFVKIGYRYYLLNQISVSGYDFLHVVANNPTATWWIRLASTCQYMNTGTDESSSTVNNVFMGDGKMTLFY